MNCTYIHQCKQMKVTPLSTCIRMHIQASSSYWNTNWCDWAVGSYLLLVLLQMLLIAFTHNSC